MAILTDKILSTTGENIMAVTVTTWRDGTLLTPTNSATYLGGLYNRQVQDGVITYFKWQTSGPYPVSRLSVVNQANFQKLINDIGTQKRSLLLDVNVAITANISIPANITILKSGGAEFVLSNGAVVTYGIKPAAFLGLENIPGTAAEFTAAVFGAVIAGLAPIAGTPGAGDTVAALFGKLKYLYDNLPMLVRAVSLAGVDGNLTGTPTASDTLLQFAGRVINFISTINAKVRGVTLTGLVKTNAAVTNADTIEGAVGKLQGQIEAFGITGEKLNVGDNVSLAGLEGAIALLTANGKISKSDYIKFLLGNLELVLGDLTHPAKATIYSNVSKLKVLSHILSGQSGVEFNANQADAYHFADALNKIYLQFISLDGAPAIAAKVPFILDTGVYTPLIRTQINVTSAGAGVKVYGMLNDGVTRFSVPMVVDTQVRTFTGRIVVQNATASTVIHAPFTSTVRRVSGGITAQNSIGTNYADAGITGYFMGLEAAPSNDKLYIFFTPATGDNTAYTGSFIEIAYS